MKIKTPFQKVFLFKLFFSPDPRGLMTEKPFSLDKLIVASSVFKKLKESSKEDATRQMREFNDKEISFSDEETSFIKELLDEVKESTPTDFEVLQELKGLVN